MVSTLRTPCAADQLLIEEVRAHEVLYACPTKSNKDNQLRDVAWQEIADTIGKTVEEAKERWRYMRDKYVKELGRSRNGSALTNGNGAVETPPDATSFIGLMSFLNPFIKRKSSNGTSNRTPTNNDNHYEMSINPHDIEPEFQSDDERQNSDGGGNIEFVSSVSDDGTSMQQHLSNGHRSASAIKKEIARSMARRHHQQSMMLRQSNSEREICALPIEATVESIDVSHCPPAKRQRVMYHQQPAYDDATSLFCASIAGMLAELQPYHRERIKRDIYNLVSDALLTELSS